MKSAFRLFERGVVLLTRKIVATGVLLLLSQMLLLSQDNNQTVYLNDEGQATINLEDLDNCFSSTLYSPSRANGDDHAIWLSNNSFAGSSTDFLFEPGVVFEKNTDGTATIKGTLYNTHNSNDKWQVELYISDKKSWSEWSALGRGYKDERGFGANDFTDWAYYIEDPAKVSKLVGLAGNAGKVVPLKHNPTDFYYGFQLGVGANNKNAGFGFSGWFLYSLDGSNYHQGDFNLDLEDLEREITYTHEDLDCDDLGENTIDVLATDQFGNTCTQEVIVTVEDNTKPVIVVSDITVDLDADGEATPASDEVYSSITDNCEVVSIVVDPMGYDCDDLGDHAVTITAIDASGNVAIATATVTVRDITPPTLVTKDINVGLNNMGMVTIDPTDVIQFDCNNGGGGISEPVPVPGAGNEVTFVATNCTSDNCGIVSFTVSQMKFDCTNVGLNTVTVTVIDASGNSTTETATVNVLDATRPTVKAKNITVELNEDGIVVVDPADVDNGSSDLCGILTLTLSKTTFNCDDLGNNQVTLIGIDGSGNTRTANAVIKVEDNLAPVVVTQNITVALDQNGQASIDPKDVLIICDDAVIEENNGGGGGGGPFFGFEPGTGEAQPEFYTEIADETCTKDNCKITSIIADIEQFDCSNIGENIVTVTVTDGEGNETEATAIVTIVDDIAPVAVAQDITAELDTNGQATITANDINNGSSDNCDITTTIDRDSFDCNDLGTQVVTLTVTDQAGNISVAAANVIVKDLIAPVVIAQSITVALDENGGAWITPAQINNGSSDNCNLTLSLGEFEFDCNDVGTNTVTLTGTDAAGNIASATAIVTIVDDILPTIVPTDITVDLDESGEAVITNVDVATVTDNCEVTFTVNQLEFDCDDLGTNNVIITATDAAGNVSTATAVVTVRDITPPTLVTKDINVGLNNMGMVTIDPTDVIQFDCNNGGGGISEPVPVPGAGDEVTFTATNCTSDNCGIVSFTVSQMKFDCTNVGLNTVTVTVTDASGNSTSETATVNVLDATRPTVKAKNITVELNEDGIVVVDPADVDNGSSDLCGILTLTLSKTTFNCDDLGNNQVTLIGIDGSGNTRTANAVIKVEDNLAPVVVTQNITVALDQNGQASIDPKDVLIICDDAVIEENNGGGGGGGPFFGFEPGTGEAQPEFYTETADATCTKDNCKITSIIADIEQFDCSNIGENIVTVTVTDGEGNETEATAIVTIVDDIAPVAVAQDITVDLDASGQAAITANQINNGSSDNCDITTTIDRDSFDCSDLGVQVVTLSVTDQGGNTSVATANVTVRDLIAPVVIAQNITVALDENGNASITTAQIDNGSSDNCNIDLSLNELEFDCDDLGQNTVTLSGTDAAGNTTSATAIVTIVDDIFPTVVSTDITVDLDENGEAVITEADIATVTDNCDVTFTVSQLEFDCDDLGTNNVTITATDAAGNVSTATAVVTVRDITPPTLVTKDINVGLNNMGMVTIQPEDLVQFDCNNGGGGISEPVPVPGAGDEVTFVATNCTSDNCGIVSFTVSKMKFDCNDLGLNTVTVTVTDASGNSSSETATVNVLDATKPDVKAKDITIELDHDGMAVITPADMDDASSDLCGNLTLTLSKTTFNCDDLGTQQVTLIGTDASGNTETAVANVTVEDNLAPVVVTQNITVALDQNGQATIDPKDVLIICDDAVIEEDNGGGGGGPFFGFEPGTGEAQPEFYTEIADETCTKDNCKITSIIADIEQFDCSNLGENIVTVTVTDGEGNETEATAIVTIVDDIAPVAIAQDITIDLDASGQATITADDIDNGSSDVCDITTSIDKDTFSCADLGQQLVTLIVTDQGGNTSVAIATVTVRDIITPTAIAQNISVSLDASGQVTISADDVDNGSSDNCDFTTTIDKTTFDCSEVGDNTVTLTVTDASGNTASATATVTVADDIFPTVVTNDITLQLDANGQIQLPALNDQQVIFEEDFESDSPQLVQAALNNWNIVNGDVDIFFPNQFGLPLVSNALDLAGDNNGTIETNQSFPFEPGTYRLSFNALGNNDDARLSLQIGSLANVDFTNFAGIVERFSYDFTVTTNTSATIKFSEFGDAPFFSGTTLDDIQLIRMGEGIVAYTEDNCDVVTVVADINDFDCTNLGENTVTVTATDVHGNITIETAIVTITDNIAPTVIAQNVTVNLDENGNASVTVTQIDNGSSDNCDLTLSVDQLTFDCSNVGENTVILTGTDASGNTTSATAIVTVVDANVPVITPNDITVSLDENGNASIDASDLVDNASTECKVVKYGNSQSHAIWLSKYFANGNNAKFHFIDSNGGALTQNPDGTATVRGTVANRNDSNDGWIIELNLDNRRSWDEWSALGRGWKGRASTVGDNYLDWSYYEMSTTAPSTLTGTGNNAGEVKTISHAPANLYYGFQVGQAANDKNHRLGFSGWFTYQNDLGNYVQGDFNLDIKECNTVVSGSPCGDAIIEVSQTDFSCTDLGDNTVTITATNYNGEVTTETATVTIVDDLAPTVLTQNITVNLDASGNATITTAQIDNGSFDNCNIDLSLNDLDFDCSDLGINTVTLTGTDAAGNTASATATVTIVDNTAPVINTQNIVVDLDASGQVTITEAQVISSVTDNCEVTETVVTQTAFDCTNIGENTVTVQAADASGNITTTSVIVTVRDVTAPTVITQDVTVNLDTNGNASITVAQVDNGSSDNCNLTLSIDQLDFDCNDIGENTVTLTGTDANGNTASTTAIVTVIDANAPVITPNDITVSLDENGNASIDAGDLVDNAITECKVVKYGNSQSHAIWLSKYFTNGNNAKFHFIDSNGGALTQNPDGTATVRGTVANRNDSNDGWIIELNLDNRRSWDEWSALGRGWKGSASTVGDNYLDWSYYEMSTTAPSTLTGTGNNAGEVKTINHAPADLYYGFQVGQAANDKNHRLGFSGWFTYQNDLGNYVQGDFNLDIKECNTVVSGSPCGDAIIEVSQTDFSCTDLGHNTVTITATNYNGEVTTETATVTIVDDLAPTVLTQNITVNLDASGNAAITTAQIDNGSFDNCNIDLSLNDLDFDCSDLGINTVTLTGTDAAGNTASATATVTIVDNTAPVINTQNIVVDLDANGQATITESQVISSATDNCEVTETVVTQTTFDCTNIGENTVTVQAADASGNITTTSAIVTVRDVTAPTVITQDVTVNLDTNGNASITVAQVDNGSSDNCNLTLSIDQLDFDCDDIGENTVTLTGTDANGNTASTTAIVTVIDANAPVITPNDITVSLDENGNASIDAGDLVDNTSTECKVVKYGNSQSHAIWLSKYFTNGNNAKFHFIDSNGGTLTQNPDGTATVRGTVANRNDSNDGWIIELNLDNRRSWDEWSALGRGWKGSASTVGDNYLDWSYYEMSTTAPSTLTGTGNNAGEVKTISHAPADLYYGFQVGQAANDKNHRLGFSGWFTYQNDLGNYVQGDFNLDIKECNTIVSGSACGDATIEVSQADFSCTDLGDNTVTVTATNYNGEVTTETVTVTVTDNIAPHVDARNVYVHLDANGQASIIASQADNHSYDNCELTLSIDEQDFDCSNLGRNTVTLTGTDASGNSDSDQFYVFVKDFIDPVITNLPYNITINDTAADCAEAVSWTVPTAVDNCQVTLTSTHQPGDTFPVGTTKVTYTAEDTYRNKVTASFYVTVVAQPVTVSLDVTQDASCAANDGAIDATVNGGCGNYTYLWSNGATTPQLNNLAPGIYSLTVTDQQGNRASSSIEVDGVSSLHVSSEVSPKHPLPTYGDKHTVYLGYGEQILTLSVDVTGGSGNYTYQWSPGDAVACASDNVATVAPQETTVYTVLITDTESGCTVTKDFPIEVIDVRCGGAYYTNTTIGDDNDQGADESCEVADAEDGGHALWLDNYNAHGSAQFIFDNNGGTLNKTDDGKATLTGVVYNRHNSHDRWEIELYLSDAMTWSEWSALGRSYKDEKGLAGNRYRDWTYYTIDPGKATKLKGLDNNSGKSQRLYHMPTNHEFGFQVGEGANNKNLNHGISGWFFYKNYRGHWTQGDFNMDLENCNISSDCNTDIDIWAGNVIMCYRGRSYCVSRKNVDYYLSRGLTLGRCTSTNSYAVATTERDDIDEILLEEDNKLETDKAPEVSIGAYPNPTSDIANITFTVSEDGPVNMGIYSTKGQLMGILYQGEAEARREYKVTFDGTAVTEGVYIIRLRTGGRLETKKLMIKR